MEQNGTEKRAIVYLEYVGGNERNVSAHKILKALTWQHRNVELVYGYNESVGSQVVGIDLKDNKEIFKLEYYRISSLRVTILQETAKQLGLIDSNIYPVLCSKVA